MKIALYIDGEKRTFTVPFIKARMLRKAIELGEQFDGKKKLSTDDIDSMAEFVVDLFDRQFTIDDLWDGLSTEEFLPELSRCMNECVNVGKPKTDPNARKRSQ